MKEIVRTLGREPLLAGHVEDVGGEAVLLEDNVRVVPAVVRVRRVDIGVQRRLIAQLQHSRLELQSWAEGKDEEQWVQMSTKTMEPLKRIRQDICQVSPDQLSSVRELRATRTRQLTSAEDGSTGAEHQLVYGIGLHPFDLSAGQQHGSVSASGPRTWSRSPTPGGRHVPTVRLRPAAAAPIHLARLHRSHRQQQHHAQRRTSRSHALSASLFHVQSFNEMGSKALIRCRNSRSRDTARCTRTMPTTWCYFFQ